MGDVFPPVLPPLLSEVIRHQDKGMKSYLAPHALACPGLSDRHPAYKATAVISLCKTVSNVRC